MKEDQELSFESIYSKHSIYDMKESLIIEEKKTCCSYLYSIFCCCCFFL